MRALFATSEIYTLNKTGGLGDVCAYLPRSIRSAGVDIRILMPAFPPVVRALEGLVEVR